MVHSSTKLSRLLAQCSLKAKPLNSLVRRFEPSTLLVSLECQNVILQERCHESRPPIFAQTLHLGPLWTGWNILGKRGLEQFRKSEKFHEDFFYQIKSKISLHWPFSNLGLHLKLVSGPLANTSYHVSYFLMFKK